MRLPLFTFIAHLFQHSAPAQTDSAPHAEAAVAVPAEEEGFENLLVLRRAVLTRDKKVAGYEFLPAEEAGTDQADAKHERSFLTFLQSVMSSAVLGKRHAFTSVSARLLDDPLLEQLARAGVIVLLRFDPEPSDVAGVVQRLQRMRAAGMVLGLADARVALAHPALGDCVKLGFLPVDQIIVPDLLDATRLLTSRHPHLQLCVSGVKSYEEFEVCRRLRMHGFIGPFATHRRDWSNNSIDPGSLRLCKLVNSLRADVEMDIIINDIKLDPLLSYRILCYANSAAIGAQHKVAALKDAILLIGREPLFRWLVLLLCASAPSHAQDHALLETALVRGRMMETLAGKLSAAVPEEFFLTGVLSLLDVILQLPAPALLAALDLPEHVKAALLQRQGPYAGLLQLAEATERAGADDIGDLCTQLGIEPQMLSAAHTEALIWARRQDQDESAEATFLTQTPSGAVPQVHPVPEQPGVPAVPTSEEANPSPTQVLAAAADAQLQAAHNGEQEAQCAMGARYATGDQVEQDLVKSLAWYTQAAQQGNAKAQWNLAAMHEQGLGGAPRDALVAIRWYQQAADQGFAAAQASLGLRYATGQGVDKDLDRALVLLQQAALQGDKEAQYNLAVLHEQGTADEPNLQQALTWFAKAAEQGLPAAQERLGFMFANGLATEPDLIEAYKWFFIASQAKHEAAKANLAHCQTLLDADQLAQAQSRAKLWLQNQQDVVQQAQVI